MGKIAPQLGEVQETLLIPLLGRAHDARSRRPILADAKAVELVDGLDYGFDRFRGCSLPGSVIRTAVFDTWVRQYLQDHPGGTVVEVGTGLNTRFDRLDDGRVHWFDLDLPDAIELRRRFFTDTDRRTMIAGSVLDTDWFGVVEDVAGRTPPMFVIEAVLVYLTDAQVSQVLDAIAHRFPGALIAFDTAGTAMIAGQARNGAMKSVDARMQWVCDDPRTLEAHGLRLLDTHTLPAPGPTVTRRLPAHLRYGLRVASMVMPVLKSYRFNLFEVPQPAEP